MADHSKELGHFLQRASDRQRFTTPAFNDGKNHDHNTTTTNTNNNALLRDFPKLDGPYSVWQEIFTHMLDDALLLTTIHRMSDPGNPTNTYTHVYTHTHKQSILQSIQQTDTYFITKIPFKIRVSFYISYTSSHTFSHTISTKFSYKISQQFALLTCYLDVTK